MRTGKAYEGLYTSTQPNVRGEELDWICPDNEASPGNCSWSNPKKNEPLGSLSETPGASSADNYSDGGD